MPYQFTPGARRALIAAAAWTGPDPPKGLAAPALLLGLLAEPECRAAILLAGHGIDVAAVRRQWPGLSPCAPPADDATLPVGGFSVEVEQSLQAASERLREHPQPLELATEHVLLGLVAAGHEVSVWLRQQGFDPEGLEAKIHRFYGHRPGPLPVEPAASPAMPAPRRSPRSPEVSSPRDVQVAGPVTVPVLRVLDAALNRAREGLRVVEDYVRFVLDDVHLTAVCKQLRHDLAAAMERTAASDRLAARETQADVGTTLSMTSQQRREDVADVLAANFARLQEGLRSLEEYGKLVDPTAAAELEQLRYRSYTLQRAVDVTRSSLERLGRARLYVLIDGRPSLDELRQLAGSLVEAGVHAIQLRDKTLDDRRLLERARLLRKLTQGSDTLLILNDRPDLAALARADGVHLGQDELAVKDARTIVGPHALIGVSTHSIEQARQAVLDGASYIGVGPTFSSGTKHFDEFPGLGLLRAVAAEIRLPAFGIGGITRENLAEVLATGLTRVAVSGAILASPDPRAAAAELLEMLARVENL